MRKIDPKIGIGGAETSREPVLPEKSPGLATMPKYDIEPIASSHLPIASGFPDWDLLPPQGLIRRIRRSL